MNTVNGFTILLVEDDENDVFFLRMALAKNMMEHALQVARDGAEAIAYLRGNEKFNDRSRYPLPDLILLDLKLPRVMGIDVLKWIREQPHFDMTAVIILTSSQQRSDIQAACTSRANSYLLKPTRPADLVEMMRGLKGYWLALNQPTATRGFGKMLSSQV